MNIRITETLNASEETIRKILHDKLNMKKIYVKSGPINLTFDPIHQQIFSEEPELMDNIIIYEETWINQCDAKTKQRSMQWKTPVTPKIKKGRVSKSNLKDMLIVFFDINGIMKIEWIPKVQTINQTYYLKFWQHCQSQFVRNDRKCGRILHHLPVLVLAPYPPDLAPSDFFLFTKIKSALKGTRLESMKEVN